MHLARWMAFALILYCGSARAYEFTKPVNGTCPANYTLGPEGHWCWYPAPPNVKVYHAPQDEVCPAGYHLGPDGHFCWPGDRQPASSYVPPQNDVFNSGGGND